MLPAFRRLALAPCARLFHSRPLSSVGLAGIRPVEEGAITGRAAPSPAQASQRALSVRLRSLGSASDVLAEAWEHRGDMHVRQLATALQMVAKSLAPMPKHRRLGVLAGSEFDNLVQLVKERLEGLTTPLNASFRVLGTLMWSIAKVDRRTTLDSQVLGVALVLLGKRLTIWKDAIAESTRRGEPILPVHDINSTTAGTALSGKTLSLMMWSIAKGSASRDVTAEARRVMYDLGDVAVRLANDGGLDNTQQGLVLWSLKKTSVFHEELLDTLGTAVRTEPPASAMNVGRVLQGFMWPEYAPARSIVRDLAPAVKDALAGASAFDAAQALAAVCSLAPDADLVERDLIASLVHTILADVDNAHVKALWYLHVVVQRSPARSSNPDLVLLADAVGAALDSNRK